MKVSEAVELHDVACRAHGVSVLNARRQLAIQQLEQGKPAFLCLDDYSNQWGCAVAAYAMGGDPHGVGTFANLPAYLVWRRSTGRDKAGFDYKHHLSRLLPLNAPAERDMAVALTLVASTGKAPTP